VNYKDRFPMIDAIMMYCFILSTGNYIKESSKKIVD